MLLGVYNAKVVIILKEENAISPLNTVKDNKDLPAKNVNQNSSLNITNASLKSLTVKNKWDQDVLHVKMAICQEVYLNVLKFKLDAKLKKVIFANNVNWTMFYMNKNVVKNWLTAQSKLDWINVLIVSKDTSIQMVTAYSN